MASSITMDCVVTAITVGLSVPVALLVDPVWGLAGCWYGASYIKKHRPIGPWADVGKMAVSTVAATILLYHVYMKSSLVLWCVTGHSLPFATVHLFTSVAASA